MEGFYDGLNSFLDNVVNESFLKATHRNMLLFEQDPIALLASMSNYVAPQGGKWIARTLATESSPRGRLGIIHHVSTSHRSSERGLVLSSHDLIRQMFKQRPGLSR